MGRGVLMVACGGSGGRPIFDSKSVQNMLFCGRVTKSQITPCTFNRVFRGLDEEPSRMDIPLLGPGQGGLLRLWPEAKRIRTCAQGSGSGFDLDPDRIRRGIGYRSGFGLDPDQIQRGGPGNLSRF